MRLIIVFMMFMISGTGGEFVIPQVCNPWIQECYPVLYESETAAINVLFDPPSVVRNGIINLDCSADEDAKVQHCVDTDNLICSLPIVAAGLAGIRSYVCSNQNKFLASAPCLNTAGFEAAWALCLNGELEVDSNCSEGRWTCVTTRLSTAEECSASDTELITGLLDVLKSSIPGELLRPCQ